MGISFARYVSTELVKYPDLNGDIDATRTLVGEALSFLNGIDNALPAPGTRFSPLAIAPSGGALSFTIGGTGQAVILGTVNGPRFVDACPALSIPIPGNAGSAVRSDIVAIEYVQALVPAGTRQVASGALVSIYTTEESIQYQYVQGPSGGGLPAVPSGWQNFAIISVPIGAANGAACTFAIQFRSLPALIAGLVSSVNGLSGALTLSAADGGVVNSNGGTHTISLGSRLPVGAVIMDTARIASLSDLTLLMSLPTPPGVTVGSTIWRLYARAEAELNAGSMVLTGLFGSWEPASVCPDLPGIDLVTLSGLANDGTAPGVRLSFPGAGLATPTYLGTLLLIACRVT